MEIPLDGNLPEVPKSKSFRVLWFVELWERFGYYGVQAILALYFVQQLGYNQTQSFYVFGSLTIANNARRWAESYSSRFLPRFFPESCAQDRKSVV